MMGFWPRLRAALRREKDELSDVIGDATDRADRSLDAKERELDATPEEKLRLEQERAADADAEFEAAKKRIEGDQSTS